MSSGKKHAELLTLCENEAWDEVIAKLKAGKVPSKQLAFANDEGLRVLHLACLEERLDVVELLLQAGADPWASDNEGTNCLHIAATLSSPPMLKLLLEAPQKKGSKANVDAADQQGSTALHPAVEPADETDAQAAAECAELLLKAGASISAQNAAGKTASDLAILAEVRSVVDAAKKGASRRGKRPTDPSTPDKKGGGGEEEEEAAAKPVAVPRGARPGGRRRRSGRPRDGRDGRCGGGEGRQGSAAPTGGERGGCGRRLHRRGRGGGGEPKGSERRQGAAPAPQQRRTRRRSPRRRRRPPGSDRGAGGALGGAAD